MRKLEEFWCSTWGGGCNKYFKTYLRANFWGNYTIECPNCKHHHFRVIKDGLVTDDRHDTRMGQAEVIVGLKSTLSDTPYHDDPAFRRQQMKVVNGAQ